VDQSGRRKTLQKKFDQNIAKLLDDVKNLMAPNAAGPASDKK
jgi:hypothetical protein